MSLCIGFANIKTKIRSIKTADEDSRFCQAQLLQYVLFSDLVSR